MNKVLRPTILWAMGVFLGPYSFLALISVLSGLSNPSLLAAKNAARGFNLLIGIVLVAGVAFPFGLWLERRVTKAGWTGALENAYAWLAVSVIPLGCQVYFYWYDLSQHRTIDYRGLFQFSSGFLFTLCLVASWTCIVSAIGTKREWTLGPILLVWFLGSLGGIFGGFGISRP